MPPTEDTTGGKEEVSGSPTDTMGGKEEVSGSPTDTEESLSERQDDREQFIPRERFDSVLSELNALRQEIQSHSQENQQNQANVGWNNVTDDQLNYIITHPLEYPQYAHVALQEKEKRMESRILGRASEQIAIQQFKSSNPEVFKPESPLGREVAKILGTQNQADVLSAALELAQYRINRSKTATDARKKVVNNLKNATTMANSTYGEESTKTGSTSFMNMSDKEFDEELNKLKLSKF